VRLRRVAGIPCASTGCPTIYAEGEDVVVQGYAVEPAEAGLDVPDGELLVRIPRSLLLDGSAWLRLEE
jgi:hypothetical protein